MIRTIKLQNFDAVEKRLDAKILVQPELDDAVKTMTERMMRGGKGAGVRNNTLLSTIHQGGATITSSLNFPRTVGTSWTRKNESIVKAMSSRVIKKAIERIEARWDTGGVT